MKLDAGQTLLTDLAGGRQNGDGDGQIETAAALGQISRCEVDGNPPVRKFQARLADRRPHPVATLADCGFDQPDDGELRQAAAHMCLDHDLWCLEPELGAGQRGGKAHRNDAAAVWSAAGTA